MNFEINNNLIREDKANSIELINKYHRVLGYF